jgi:hypothetical protein
MPAAASSAVDVADDPVGVPGERCHDGAPGHRPRIASRQVSAEPDDAGDEDPRWGNALRDQETAVDAGQPTASTAEVAQARAPARY